MESLGDIMIINEKSGPFSESKIFNKCGVIVWEPSFWAFSDSKLYKYRVFGWEHIQVSPSRMTAMLKGGVLRGHYTSNQN